MGTLLRCLCGFAGGGEKAGGMNSPRPPSFFLGFGRAPVKGCWNRQEKEGGSGEFFPPSFWISAPQQALGDLHRVQRGALQQLVAGDEERHRAAGGIAEIGADAANQHIPLT